MKHLRQIEVDEPLYASMLRRALERTFLAEEQQAAFNVSQGMLIGLSISLSFCAVITYPLFDHTTWLLGVATAADFIVFGACYLCPEASEVASLFLRLIVAQLVVLVGGAAMYLLDECDRYSIFASE